MKKFLVGAVATAALLVPAIASAETNAVVGLEFGNTDFDGGDFDRLNFNGGFSHDMNNGWLFQMDGEHGRIDESGSPEIATGYGAAHLGVRNESHALAGFVSFQDFFGISGTGFGVEGQMYLNSFVLGGSIGHADFGDADLTATSFQVDGAYYFTPNLSVNALLATSEADFGGGGEDEWTSMGVGGEFRFHGPFSVHANWRNDEYDGYEADTWKIGFSYDFGTGSLHERATTGPSLQGASNLSDSIGGLLP